MVNYIANHRNAGSEETMKRFLGALCALLLLAVFFVPAVVLGESEETVRVIVRTNDPVARESLSLSLNVRFDFGDLGFTTEIREGQMLALRDQANIEVEEVEFYHISKPPGACDPWPECKNGGGEERAHYPEDQTPWGIELIYDDPDITSTSGGEGIDVAVLDTGVYKDHLDLAGRVEQCVDFTGKGRPGQVPIKVGKCSDDVGHGTHVAGTILADGGSDGLGIYGIAPESDLFAYKVCTRNGCWADDIAVAIKYAANNGAEIISMSLGGDTQNSLIKDAIDYATSEGVLVVAAAGNDGSSEGSIDYPGANAKVIAVGAIDINENVPYWSSRGINDGDYVIEEREVEFGAPGVNVESAWKNGGYEFMDGTSSATPHISGLAAKLWQGNALATREYLQDTAQNHDLHIPGDDSATGFGLPQVP